MDFEILRVPAPSHRHGTPSGPWPFLDLNDQIDSDQLKSTRPSAPTYVCDHTDAKKCKGCWSSYPQSLFPNWTPAQQKRSRISKIVDRLTDTCTIHYVDISEDGTFCAFESLEVSYTEKDIHWEFMRAPRPTGTRIRAMFLHQLSGPVLQMIGTKYNIEPFFFSSSLGWIPSRYREAVEPNKGDHITIILTFIRTIHNPTTVITSPSSSYTASTTNRLASRPSDQIIDTQAPLSIQSSDHILLPDLIALHMVRSSSTSTIVSYHPGHEYFTTTASELHARLNAAGRSVYWNTIFSNHDDPTFVLLSLLWYSLYAWDETLEVLYAHICWLESSVIRTNDMHLSQELHIVQAHILHYTSLLEDFRKSIIFVLDTPNPALDDAKCYSPEQRARSHELLQKECRSLLGEIDRLEQSMDMQGKRLKNVMNLSFSSVNIEDSRYMQKLTEAAVRDSAAVKQVAYLTMFFLPASLAAGIFGMNVKEFNPESRLTIHQYLAIALPMTVITVWVVVALQFHPGRDGLREDADGYNLGRTVDSYGQINETSLVWRTLGRVGWPIMFMYSLLRRCRKANSDAKIKRKYAAHT